MALSPFTVSRAANLAPDNHLAYEIFFSLLLDICLQNKYRVYQKDVHKVNILYYNVYTSFWDTLYTFHFHTSIGT
jgi:hypothetical protein